ncbi:MAG: hypothetical protein K2Y27_26385 [Xanthobacteraceae bacterium]|nr:hypothetical protein [Xanthobacteraceae bacterium]
MKRFAFLMGISLVLGAVAYGLGHYMDAKGIRSSDDSRIVAQEQVERRELATRPPSQ